MNDDANLTVRPWEVMADKDEGEAMTHVSPTPPVHAEARCRTTAAHALPRVWPIGSAARESSPLAAECT